MQNCTGFYSLLDLEQIIIFQKWRTCNFSWIYHCSQPLCAGSNRLENVVLRLNFLINIMIVVTLWVSFSSKLFVTFIKVKLSWTFILPLDFNEKVNILNLFHRDFIKTKYVSGLVQEIPKHDFLILTLCHKLN